MALGPPQHVACGDVGGAGGGDVGGDADAVAPSGPPSSTGTGDSELGCTCSVQAAVGAFNFIY